MIYSLLKLFARIALKIFCRKVSFSDKSVLASNGPLLLACNHPNSFFDAILIGSYFDKPVHFLARGDAFRRPIIRKILHAFNMIPIYRLSEGREYLALNDATFELCISILSQGGIVLIFSEGLCEHKWELRPLKKGTARIALKAWNDAAMSTAFRVIPVSLNYDSFSKLGKRIRVGFGDAIKNDDLRKGLTEGEYIGQFNRLLASRLDDGIVSSTGISGDVQFLLTNLADQQIQPIKERVRHIAKQNLSPEIRSTLSTLMISRNNRELLLNLFWTIVLALPAVAGWILHALCYYPLRTFIKRKTEGTVFFDSVLFGMLLIFYPVYYLCCVMIAGEFLPASFLWLFLPMPLFAWIYLIWSAAIKRVFNEVLTERKSKAKLKAILA